MGIMDILLASGFGRIAPPMASTVPLTPGFNGGMPPVNGVSPSMAQIAGGVTPDETDQLDAQLKAILSAKQPKSKRRTIANVIRSGLAAAAQPNRAHGGPMDMIAALAGGMGNMQQQELQDEALFNQRQQQQARNTASIVDVLRRKQTADAQVAAYKARQAAAEAQAANYGKEKNVFQLGDRLVVRQPDGTLQDVTPPKADAETERIKKQKTLLDQYTRDYVAAGYDKDTAYRMAASAVGIKLNEAPRPQREPTGTVSFDDEGYAVAPVYQNGAIVGMKRLPLLNGQPQTLPSAGDEPYGAPPTTPKLPDVGPVKTPKTKKTAAEAKPPKPPETENVSRTTSAYIKLNHPAGLPAKDEERVTALRALVSKALDDEFIKDENRTRIVKGLKDMIAALTAGGDSNAAFQAEFDKVRAATQAKGDKKSNLVVLVSPDGANKITLDRVKDEAKIRRMIAAGAKEQQ